MDQGALNDSLVTACMTAGDSLPLAPVGALPVAAALALLPLPRTQAAGLRAVTVSSRGLGHTLEHLYRI